MIDKKTYNVNLNVTDYGNSDYDSNIDFYNEFYSLNVDDQLLILESIKNSIQTKIDIIADQIDA